MTSSINEETAVIDNNNNNIVNDDVTVFIDEKMFDDSKVGVQNIFPDDDKVVIEEDEGSFFSIKNSLIVFICLFVTLLTGLYLKKPQNTSLTKVDIAFFNIGNHIYWINSSYQAILIKEDDKLSDNPKNTYIHYDGTFVYYNLMGKYVDWIKFKFDDPEISFPFYLPENVGNICLNRSFPDEMFYINLRNQIIKYNIKTFSPEILKQLSSNGHNFSLENHSLSESKLIYKCNSELYSLDLKNITNESAKHSISYHENNFLNIFKVLESAEKTFFSKDESEISFITKFFNVGYAFCTLNIKDEVIFSYINITFPENLKDSNNERKILVYDNNEDVIVFSNNNNIYRINSKFEAEYLKTDEELDESSSNNYFKCNGKFVFYNASETFIDWKCFEINNPNNSMTLHLPDNTNDILLDESDPSKLFFINESNFLIHYDIITKSEIKLGGEIECGFDHLSHHSISDNKLYYMCVDGENNRMFFKQLGKEEGEADKSCNLFKIPMFYRRFMNLENDLYYSKDSKRLYQLFKISAAEYCLAIDSLNSKNFFVHSIILKQPLNQN